MRRAPAAVRWLLPLLVFAAIVAIFTPRASTARHYKIDEAHKIGETYFLGLARSGQVHHPDWFDDAVNRANPPVGKYLFGLSILLHGHALPPDLSMARAGVAQIQPPPALAERYRPALIAARRVSVLATAVTAVVLWVAATRLYGMTAAVLAVALYLTNFLTRTFAATAIFDPLLTCAVTLTLLPLLQAWNSPRFGAMYSILAGLISGVAFQVRATGLVALAATVVVFVALAIRHRSFGPILHAVLATVVCFLLATAINPYYWATDQSDEPLSTRVWNRYATQFRDQEQILASQQQDSALRLAQRPGFVVQIAAGDWPGMITLLGCAIVLFFVATNRSRARGRLAFAAIWTGVVIGAVILWLPLAWPRYVLVVVPPLAFVAALGWSELLAQIVARYRVTGSSRTRVAA